MRNGHLTLLARLTSILGHPLLLMPAAGLAAWITLNGVDAQAVWIVIAAGLGAMVVLGYSYWRVHSGAWAHVDASQHGERRSLNGFLLVFFLAAALIGFVLAWPPAVLLSLLLSASMVAAAILLTPWCKSSLHLAFAVFAAGLLYAVSVWAVAVGLLVALAIAWSRLHLGRHVFIDLWCGAAAGAAAGMAFWVGLQRLQG